MSSKIWLITGASAGLGLSVTKHVLSQGDIAIATCRNPTSSPELVTLSAEYDNSKLLILPLDVTKPSEIASAFSNALSHFGRQRIDVVYSNAGYGVLGEVEGIPEEVARELFEVNFWGAVNVTKEAVRVFREINKPPGGRLMVASSSTAVRGTPGMAYLSASKFALDGLHEALSKELKPEWNIKITLLSLGGVATRALTPTSLVTVPPHPAYTDKDAPTTIVRGFLSNPSENKSVMTKSEEVSEALYKITNDDGIYVLRVPVGAHAIGMHRERAEVGRKEADEGVRWSERIL